MMKGLLIFAACLMLTQAQYPESIAETGGDRDHAEIFRDGELTRVLSKLIGQNVAVQSDTSASDRTLFSSNSRGQQQNQQQQYGAPNHQGSGNQQNQQYGPPSQGSGNQQNQQNQNQQYGPPTQGPENQQQQQQRQQYGQPGPPQGSGNSGSQQQGLNREYSVSAQFTLPFGERTRPRQSNRPSTSSQIRPQQQQQFMPIRANSNFNQVNTEYSQQRVNQPQAVQPQREFQQNNQQQGYTSSIAQLQGNQPQQTQRQVSGQQDQGNSQGQRFVYLYVPPPELVEAPRKRVISPPQKPDTNYQIIFVKAPSPANQQAVEIQMPSPPEQKTLVYVLVKKPQDSDNEIRFSSPPTTTPAPPEVYFIKYKRNQNLPSTSDANFVQSQGQSGQEDFETERISEKLQQSSQPSRFMGEPRNAGGRSASSTASGGYQDNNPVRLLESPRLSSSSTSTRGSHYSAPGSKSWDSSSTNQEVSRMRLTTSNYIPPMTSDESSGGYQ